MDIQTVENAHVAKNIQREVLDQIIEDLKIAAEYLPESQPEEFYGYVTRGSAYGLLSRVFLFDEQWDNAAEYSLKVINLNQYNLFSPYDKQFTYEGEYSKDVTQEMSSTCVRKSCWKWYTLTVRSMSVCARRSSCPGH